MTSIEINGSFYSLQRPSSYRSWREQVPDDFVFAVKGGRFITHMKKLRDAEQPLANFFASGVLALGPTLGPLLWQLPENLPYDRERLEQFFSQLPQRELLHRRRSRCCAAAGSSTATCASTSTTMPRVTRPTTPCGCWTA